LLLLPDIDFVPWTDPLMVNTAETVRRELDSDGLILRYRTDDGIEGGEGVFLACTFWLAECLARQGRIPEAHAVFRRAAPSVRPAYGPYGRAARTIPGMLEFPTPHAAAALALTLVTFAAFAAGRIRVELVCLLLIAVLALGFHLFPLVQEGRFTGIEVAFGGFGHEALVAICSLMILGRGLTVTGALEPVARLLARLWRLSDPVGLLFSIVGCMALSMFVNDTPVLVLALPILLSLATRAGAAPSKTLMPVNCAILIGGMATTIGTSTNLLVVSIAQDLGEAPIGIFDFTPLVLIAGAIALPYLWLVMPRLLPATETDAPVAARTYRGTLHALVPHKAIAATLGRVMDKVGGVVKVAGVLHLGRSYRAPERELALDPSDRVLIEGTADQLREASAMLRAPLAAPEVLELVRSSTTEDHEDERMAEVVVGADSNLVGRSVKTAAVADRYGVAVIGTARAEAEPLWPRTSPQTEELGVGDVLLVRGTPQRLARFELGENVLQLQGGIELPRTARAGIALLIVTLVIVMAATRILPIAIAALAGVIAMLATRCVRFEGLGRALSLEVIVLIAASIALGRALVETGAAGWLGQLFALALGGMPPAGVVAAVIVFTAVLTNFVSNAAAAAIGTPLAVSLARELGIPAEPLVLAVLFGCNICYVTPMAYQTNLLIMSAARYQFRDFVRAGLPLALLMVVTLALLLVREYGL
jgi:di/tricarboxylate transporter